MPSNAFLDLLPDMDERQLPDELDAAVRKVALAVAAHHNPQIKGEVSLTIKICKIRGSGQLALEHTLKIVSPLDRGKESKTTDGDTIVHIETGVVDRGALAVRPENQLDLLEADDG